VVNKSVFKTKSTNITDGHSLEFIPFGRPSFGEGEKRAVQDVLESGWVGMGQETLAFEQELSSFLGVEETVSVNSCTSALHLSLIAAGVEPDDEVICPSFTWCSTANAALFIGARVRFADIDPKTLCVSKDTILKKLTAKTKAVIVVHYGGYATDVEEIRSALPSNVSIIEDAAHALGARYPDGTMVGTSGNLTCFSFYANKNLSTGDGGCVTLRDKRIADRLRSLRQHGLPLNAWSRYTDKNSLLLSGAISELGFKMNYTDLQAAIGRVQLQRFNDMQSHRHAVVLQYLDNLDTSAMRLGLQRGCGTTSHANHLFTVQLPQPLNDHRNEILMSLREKNVGASLHYAPLHSMPLYDQCEYLPITEKVAANILTLPLSASITADDVDYVCYQFKEVCGAFGGLET
jgi:perosamine synthetase